MINKKIKISKVNSSSISSSIKNITQFWCQTSRQLSESFSSTANKKLKCDDFVLTNNWFSPPNIIKPQKEIPYNMIASSYVNNLLHKSRKASIIEQQNTQETQTKIKDRKRKMSEALKLKAKQKKEAKSETGSKEETKTTIKRKRNDLNSIEAPLSKFDKPSAQRVIKCKINPTKEQLKKLKEAFGVARFTYNTCLSAMKSENTILSQKLLRSRFLNSDSEFVKDKKWILNVPYSIRDAALKDLITAYKGNITKKMKDTTFKFNIRYRSKKTNREIINICSKDIKKNGSVMPEFFGKEPFNCGSRKNPKRLPAKIDYDCILESTATNKYYLIIPRPLTKRSIESSKNEMEVESKSEKCDVITLDPGVRTFLSGYCSNGIFLELGKQDIQKLYKIGINMDKLNSKISKCKTGIKRKRMRLAWHRMQERIRNLRLDIHHKWANFLCAHFTVILLPTLNSTQMSGRLSQSIGSKSVRKMMIWSHSTFRDRLYDKSKEYEDTHVIKNVNEAYTSKTCGLCGTLNHKLGSSKVSKCSECLYECDRDYNGARNTFIRYLTEHCSMNENEQ